MNSGHDTSEEAKNKNVGKHARVFDVDAMFSAAVHSAQMSSAEATMARLGRQEEESGDQEEKEGTNSADRQKARIEQRKATEGICKIRIPDAERNSADDGDEIGPPMPNKMTASEENEDDDEFVGPPMPPDFSGDKSTQVSEEEKQRILDSGIVDEEDEEEFDDFAGVPIVQMIPAGCEATIRHGKKPVSALAFDYQGLRFLTGGYDYMVDLFEFQKMDMTLKPTRELMPVESHVITSLSFNANGEHILVGSGNAQLRLLDRRGHQWAETVRGDQYLVDLTNTKGHTAAVNCCCWNPLLKDEFCSAGDDGTLRLWNLEDYKQITHCINKQRTVIKTKNANGKRAIPTSCCYSRDAKLIAAGCDDGSLQIWKYGKIFVAPKYLNRAAHKGPITCLAFSPDGKRILTRGLDDALKMFELANIKEPVLTADKLENNFPMTDCGFSPRGEMVYTGTSVRSDAEDAAGRLLFLDASNFDPVYQIQYPGLSCIRIAWHPKLNQMLTGLSDGTCRLYYDLAQSHRGALECVTRPLRRQRKAEVIKEEMILAPLTLEMFQARGEDNEEKEVTSWRLKKYLRNQDNKLRPAFRKPAELPMSGPSTGGRIAAHGGTLHSYVAQQVGVKRNMELVNDDVRASILRHAEEAEANPMYVAQAYLKNQPKPIFQEKTTEPEDEDEYDAEDSHPFKMPRMAQ